MRRMKTRRRREKNNTLIKFLGFICIFSLVFIACNKMLDDTYENERKKMTSEDTEAINEVIQLAKDKEGLEYVWGGKGEVMTEKRLNELIGYYSIDYYPLDKEEYIGNQAFDCSGLTYWIYKEVTDVFIGYSTTEQQEILKDYKVSSKNLQPGDIIFTPGHVVMYIGDGKIINSANKNPYPDGGVKIEGLWLYRFGEVYRPIDYIRDVKRGL
ncbi:MAG: NlpC/P60 family protein [Bacilli bacterium]